MECVYFSVWPIRRLTNKLNASHTVCHISSFDFLKYQTHRGTCTQCKIYHLFHRLFLSLPFSFRAYSCWLSESVSCMVLPCRLFMVLSLQLLISTAFMPQRPYFEVYLHLPHGTPRWSSNSLPETAA